jgi:hypothetical protein
MRHCDVKEATGDQAAMHEEAFRNVPGQTLLSQMMMEGLPGIPEPELTSKTAMSFQLELRFSAVCPGHALGHVCLYGEGCLHRDALFAGGSAFDLPGGWRRCCAA